MDINDIKNILIEKKIKYTEELNKAAEAEVESRLDKLSYKVKKDAMDEVWVAIEEAVNAAATERDMAAISEEEVKEEVKED